MSDKKKRSWLSRLGFKSKEEKLALEASKKAEEEKIIDSKMAEKMALINAAALKAESKNIILYGDVSPKIAKQTLEKMEIYRRLIMTLGGLDPYIDDEEKITIYLLEFILIS